jgi:hypothetical protein
MLHAPLASCTVGEVKVALIPECVVGDSRALTRDLQSSGTLLVTQMCFNDAQVEEVLHGGKGIDQSTRMTHLGGDFCQQGFSLAFHGCLRSTKPLFCLCGDCVIQC